MRKNRRTALFLSIAALGALLVPATDATAQTEPAADEIVVSVSVPIFSFIPNDMRLPDMVFEARCEGIDEPQQATVTHDDLEPYGSALVVVAKHPDLTTCDVEATEVPLHLVVTTPYQNLEPAAAAGSLLEWEFESVDLESDALLELIVRGRLDNLDIVRQTVPAFVGYSCNGDAPKFERVWPGFGVVGLFDLVVTDGLIDEDAIYLRKRVPVSSGTCSAWAADSPGLGIYLNGRGRVTIEPGVSNTITFVARYAPNTEFTCNGVPATIVGTGSNDFLRGTTGDDVIYADGGDDIVKGGGGADIICGGPGDDQLWGNAGKDLIFGEDGDDTLRGGRGRDDLRGGTGTDLADGGINVDTCDTETTLRCE